MIFPVVLGQPNMRGLGNAASDLAGEEIALLSSQITNVHLLTQDLHARSPGPETTALLEDIGRLGTIVDGFADDPGFVAPELQAAQRSYENLLARYAHLQSRQTRNVVLLALGAVAVIGVGAYFVWKRG